MEEIKIQFGREELTIATGKFAKQAGGSVTVQYGETMVLVTVCCASEAKDGADFFPLTVEYQEKTYAAGRIPGGFFKREGRPSQKAILSCRMIDRPIRPLFPDGMLNEVQLVATVLSSDGKNDSDVIALIGASAALMISEIPFDGPIGCVRVGMNEEGFIINPTFAETEKSPLDLVVVGNADSVIMLEAGAKEISEEKVLEAIKFGHEALKPLLDMQVKLQRKAGKPKREDITVVDVNKEIYDSIKKTSLAKIREVLQIPDKIQRIEQLELLQAQIIKEYTAGTENGESLADQIKLALQKVEKEVVRNMILTDKKRIDGREFSQIRKIECETNVLPKTHGSGLFTRGETQALAVTTLGTSADEQRIDALEGESLKSFMLHYNFPSFSVGETRPMRGPGRREIGHGALAEKALTAVLPDKDKFPYTIRLVSEILESNGSSSMATVCAGSLALMASGVPISSAVSGIAMGMIKEDDRHVILTDIAGAEDHFGDMDFKVAGTKGGITAVQMDLKLKGIDFTILEEAFAAARKARLSILEKMNQAISEPAEKMSPDAPKIVTIKLKPDKISEVIGSGGKVIKKIIADSGAEINIDDEGNCQVSSPNQESLDKAVNIINGIIAEPEVGRIYDARITKLMNFGAFCEFLPGQEGLIHVSELAAQYVKNVADVVKEGQMVKVKIVAVDELGRPKLSIKQVEENKD
ncbi:MAG: polyribonucleotide nucleotidyltransferase [Candidatus Omnitrophota bacterium]